MNGWFVMRHGGRRSRSGHVGLVGVIIMDGRSSCKVARGVLLRWIGRVGRLVQRSCNGIGHR